MHIDLIHRFTATSTHCLDVQLKEDQLGILSGGILPGSPPYTYLTSLALVNIPQKQCGSILTYDSRGPGTEDIWSALLRYDASQKHWVIGLLQGFEYIGLRTVMVGADQRLSLSPFCLLDFNEDYTESFRPLLDLEIREPQYRLLYHKPSQEEHGTAAVVVKQDLACQPGWDALEDRAAVVRSGDDGKDAAELADWHEWQAALKQQGIPEKGKKAHQDRTIFFPAQISLDAKRFSASSTTEISLVDQAELAESEMALTIADQQTRLLVLCCPETWVRPNDQTRSEEEIEQTGEQWRIWLTGWDRAELTHQWSYSPNIGLPADPNIPTHEVPKPPAVEVAAIAGPRTRGDQPTFVAAMAMQGGEQLFSHGVCLTQNGQVVQVCSAPLGRYPSLCACQQTVIGVDRLESGWRLWNWAVLDEPGLHATLALDATCQRACVRAQTGADRFWLIEESPAGVRVSLRDAQTLAELTPAQMIEGAHLASDLVDRPLEPHRTPGLIPYRETLLVLVLNEQGGMELYQAVE